MRVLHRSPSPVPDYGGYYMRSHAPTKRTSQVLLPHCTATHPYLLAPTFVERMFDGGGVGYEHMFVAHRTPVRKQLFVSCSRMRTHATTACEKPLWHKGFSSPCGDCMSTHAVHSEHLCPWHRVWCVRVFGCCRTPVRD